MSNPTHFCEYCDIYITYADDHERSCWQHPDWDSVRIEQLTFADYFDIIAEDMGLFQGNYTTSFDIQNDIRLKRLKKQWD